MSSFRLLVGSVQLPKTLALAMVPLLAGAMPAIAEPTSQGSLVGNQPLGSVRRQGEINDRLKLSDTEAVAQDFENFVAGAVAQRPSVAQPVVRQAALPANIAWWNGAAAAGGKSVTLKDLIARATRSSFQIGVFGALPAIRDTGIDEARGRFTPEAYAEVRRSDREDRTTALAQTAGDLRLTEIDNSVEVGVRSRLRTGAQVTLSQRFSNLNTNNIVFNPQRQSRARTTLSVIQPLIREAGFDYNNAIEKIAGLEAESAKLEFRRQAESHLLQIVRSYWTLYLAQANYAQEKRAATTVEDLSSRLGRRTGLDAQPLQLSRARAVSAERAAGLVRAANAIRNAEARLFSLVNDADLGSADGAGLTLVDVPSSGAIALDAKALMATAMAQRPEVRTAFLSYRSALLREGMARNERMPQLDLVLEASTNGGNGNGAIFPSFGDAWSERPSYTVGARFSVPLGKDERRARYERRRIETMQQALQARSTIDTVGLEVEVSVNELAAANDELLRRAEALQLANADQGTIIGRWQAGLTGGGNVNEGVLYLDQLLNAQDRQTSAELDYAEAQASAMVAAVNLSRARGTLLSDFGYQIERNDDDGRLLPTYRLVANTVGAAK